MVIQVSGQILLLLLSITKTETTSGLETVLQKSSLFGISSQTLLILSVLISLKTLIFLHIKWIEVEKAVLGFTSKIMILFWATFASGRRITAIICFFVPSLGLCDLLFHWKAEHINFFRSRFYAENDWINPNATLDMYNLNRTVLWSEIDRWNYTDPEKFQHPDYTVYTGLTMGGYFFLFLAIMVVQIFAIIIVKVLSVDGLKWKDWFDLVLHCLENSNIPFPWRDWDQGGGNLYEYRRRFKNVNKEMMWTMIVNLFFHLLLMTPLLFTGFIEL